MSPSGDARWHHVDSGHSSAGRQVFAGIDCNYDKGQLSSVGRKRHRPPLRTIISANPGTNQKATVITLECHRGPKTPFCLQTISQPYYFQLKQCPDLYSIRGGRIYKRLQDISSHITFINICHNISRKSTVIAFAGPAEATGLSRRLRACPEWPQVA